MLVQICCDTMMALLMTIYTNKLETGENVYMIASERSERAEFVYICFENIQFFLIIILLINHCLSVQLCPCVRNTRDMVLFIMPTRKPETRDIPTNHCERTERASRNVCTFASKTYFSYRPENQKL